MENRKPSDLPAAIIMAAVKDYTDGEPEIGKVERYKFAEKEKNYKSAVAFLKSETIAESESLLPFWCGLIGISTARVWRQASWMKKKGLTIKEQKLKARTPKRKYKKEAA